MNLKTKCPLCGSEKVISISSGAYADWKHNGVLIQDAMPELSTSDRERLMTGICDPCWQKMGGDE